MTEAPFSHFPNPKTTDGPTPHSDIFIQIFGSWNLRPKRGSKDGSSEEMVKLICVLAGGRKDGPADKHVYCDLECWGWLRGEVSNGT